MTKIKRGRSTIKQMAYARRVFNGDGESKAQVALDVGYTPAVSRSVTSHIEQKPGFHAAMMKLALESNNLALSAIEEFKVRGFTEFTNTELIAALNAIGGAWAKFNDGYKDPNGSKEGTNRLRTVILNQIENATMMSPGVEVVKEKEVEKTDLDF